jgi:hypothetical protein
MTSRSCSLSKNILFQINACIDNLLSFWVAVFMFNGEGATVDARTFQIKGARLRYVHAIMVPTRGRGRGSK